MSPDETHALSPERRAAALGERIRSVRQARQESLAKVARRAGITAAYLHAVENATPSGSTGRPSIPSVPFLRSIADALEADRVELLEIAGYEEEAAWDRVLASRRMESNLPASLGGKLNQLSPEKYGRLEAYLDGLLDDAQGQS